MRFVQQSHKIIDRKKSQEEKRGCLVTNAKQLFRGLVMRKNKILILFLVIFTLTTTNIVTLLYLNHIIHSNSEQLVFAYDAIMVRDNEISRLEGLENENNRLTSENQTLNTTNENLTSQKEQLSREQSSLKQQVSEQSEEIVVLTNQNLNMNRVLEKYNHFLDYEPEKLSEYQTYIKELEQRVEKSGSFDIYEVPKRKKVYEGYTIWLEDGASERWADQAMEYLRLIPAKALEALNKDKWYLIITPRSLEEVYHSGVENTIGLTIYYRKRIYIKNEEFSIDSCTLHEIGHALDALNSYQSFTEGFNDVFNQESAASGLSKYFTSSPTEYFAETFQNYFISPEITKKNAPKSYAFIEKFLEKYE